MFVKSHYRAAAERGILRIFLAPPLRRLILLWFSGWLLLEQSYYLATLTQSRLEYELSCLIAAIPDRKTDPNQLTNVIHLLLLP